MAKKYSSTHEVVYYECDVNQNMTLPALVAVAVKVSEEQSESLDRSSDYVHKLGLGWVITSYQIRLKRLPKAGEIIKVTTQAQEYNKYFCYRNFWFTAEDGTELALVESVFVLMNQETRKLSSVPEDVIAPYECEKVTKIKRSPAIEKIENGRVLPYRVRFYDIDSNQHVNNSVYFNWMIDSLSFDFLTSYVPAYINIRFDKEVEYGVEIESRVEEVETEEGYRTRHEIHIGDALYCEANITWEKK